MKVRLDSYYDDLPLGKILSFSVLNIIVESVLQHKDKYYPKVFIYITADMSVSMNHKKYV